MWTELPYAERKASITAGLTIDYTLSELMGICGNSAENIVCWAWKTGKARLGESHAAQGEHGRRRRGGQPIPSVDGRHSRQCIEPFRTTPRIYQTAHA